jgi:hypothetical protein
MPRSKTTPSATADLDALIEEDAKSVAVRPDTLAMITTEAHRMVEMATKAEELEKQAKEAAAEARRISEQILPPLMDEAGVPMLGLDDGSVITRSEQIYANIAKDNLEDATEWLVANGYGALVKNAFTIPVDKGDVKAVARIRSVLIKGKIEFDEAPSVHPRTLVAFVKESLAEGRQLPEAITYHIQPRVDLKKSKSKK